MAAFGGKLGEERGQSPSLAALRRAENTAQRPFITMVILGFLLVLALGIYGVWRLSARPSGHRYDWSLVWRLACLIAAFRISAVWLGLAGLRRSDWVQVPAFFMLMVGWPDIYIVSAARAEPLRWGILASLVLAATSLAWSAALLWVVRRLRNEPATRSEDS